MKVEGFIFKIGNDMNDRIYIGETTRTLDLRFNEICFDTRSTSIIHKAIQENGWQHFRIDLIDESYEESLNVIDAVKNKKRLVGNYTKGHYRRGVE